MLEPDTGCWLWLGAVKRNGYGGLRHDGVNLYAHRVSYECHRGPIPIGLELDHLCRVRHCINPDHLEPVTHSQNVRRGTAGSAVAVLQRMKTHCPAGHPYDEANTYQYKQKRQCRACKMEWKRRRAANA
jgi:hypothetical protein